MRYVILQTAPPYPAASVAYRCISMEAAGGLHHGLPSQKVTSQYRQNILGAKTNSANRETQWPDALCGKFSH